MNLPAGTGPRRVKEAIRLLFAENLITTSPLADGKEGLLLLHPDGSGKEWDGNGTRWIGVPLALWSNAWILKLSGRALVVLLALLELNGGSKHPDGELMDGHRKKQYGLSDDTWTRATQELERYGLLRTTKVRWGDDDYEIRQRKRYFIIREKLEVTPDWSVE
ncbi:hypothetical protein [Salinibacterium sp. SWN167]|uniref:hypothetical protein n=1 Tax=Salinibacterium sp. SWN167 TaxID=2792054 RepID=UPI0018CCE990|nr:hypothetical protein [Salinibacterium sp. SWN167]MBH0082229.1 hypothetical protein [Salinibacterium sp. SWN167]